MPDEHDLAALDARLAPLSADERIRTVLDTLPGPHVLSSSFGAQAAVLLHLVTRQAPDIPVVLIDTGYLFPETYRFVDTLTMDLGLNLKVFQAEISPAWVEARYGRLWEQGVDGIERYNALRKVRPMQRALDQLGAGTWIAGLRRSQSSSRARVPFVELRNGRCKVHPIADWTDRDVGLYLQRHRLPYHPLWEQGYVSIGDWHTTHPLHAVDSEEETRFFGLKRECGLHGLEG
jgi:phosphoadenosine phosphosulfate reductase